MKFDTLYHKLIFIQFQKIFIPLLRVPLHKYKRNIIIIVQDHSLRYFKRFILALLSNILNTEFLFAVLKLYILIPIIRY